MFSDKRFVARTETLQTSPDGVSGLKMVEQDQSKLLGEEEAYGGRRGLCCASAKPLQLILPWLVLVDVARSKLGRGTYALATSEELQRTLLRSEMDFRRDC